LKYNIDYGLMMNGVNRFKSAEKAMRGFSTRLHTVKDRLGKITEIKSFQVNVEARAQALDNICDALRDSEKCLDAIWREYHEAEKKVTWISVVINWFRKLFGRGKDYSITDPGDGCGKPRPIFIPVPLPINIIEPKPPKPPPKPPPKKPAPQQKPPPGTFTDAEREADMRMQREARAIEQKYLPQWRAARTVEQKQAVLNNMLAELQAVKGTNANPQIEFTRVGPKGYAGQYSPGSHSIQINMDHGWFNSPDALGVVMHEVRHAYQAEASGIARGYYNPNHQVSPERAQLWRDRWSREYFYDLHCADARWFSGGR